MDIRPIWGVALALCLVLPAAAQMYKWKDENGKWQYSDKPPAGNIKTEKLSNSARPAPAPADSDKKADASKDGGAAKDGAAKTGPKTVAEQEQAFRKRRTDAAKALEETQKKEAEARDKEDNCKRAKQSLASLESGTRQTRFDEKGERAFLNEEQIAKEIAKAREAAASTCK